MGFGLAVFDELFNYCPQMTFTTLHYTAGKGRSEIAKLLLTAEAAIKIRNKVWYASLNSDHNIHRYCMELSLCYHFQAV